jgi:hypothetical protein
MDTSELLTEDSDWHLTVSSFEPAREHEVETLLTIANGYAGTRGALEEGSPASRMGTYLAGVFDPVRQTPDPPHELSETPRSTAARPRRSSPAHGQGQPGSTRVRWHCWICTPCTLALCSPWRNPARSPRREALC